jgi:hypothetical protein
VAESTSRIAISEEIQCKNRLLVFVSLISSTEKYAIEVEVVIIFCQSDNCLVLNKLFIGHDELQFNLREWEQLLELVKILGPYALATDLCQGEKFVTVSCVVPSILSFFQQTSGAEAESKHLRGFCRVLITSLQTRFRGIFVNTDPDTRHPAISEAFGDVSYLSAVMLDPDYDVQYIDYDVACDEEQKSVIKSNVKKWCVEFMQSHSQCSESEPSTDTTSTAESDSNDDDDSSSEDEEPAVKAPKLFAYGRKESSKSKSASASKEKPVAFNSLAVELNAYTERVLGTTELDCLAFWKSCQQYPRLRSVAKDILAVPASSAPVERIFSTAGYIMRPNRNGLR